MSLSNIYAGLCPPRYVFPGIQVVWRQSPGLLRLMIAVTSFPLDTLECTVKYTVRQFLLHLPASDLWL
jgi:hypothetical protein